MLGNKIYQALILLFIITACAPPSANVSAQDAAEQQNASGTVTDNDTESLEKQLEAERAARLEAERKLEEMKRRPRPQTNETAVVKPKAKAHTETLKTPDVGSTTDIASEYDRVVEAYVEYLDGLPGNERSSACSRDADLSQLNKLQRAALRDACEVAGNNNLIVKPAYPQRQSGTDPEPQPQPQPENAETVDSLIKIFEMVLRGFGR
jgi:hypothetical protein